MSSAVMCGNFITISANYKPAIAYTAKIGGQQKDHSSTERKVIECLDLRQTVKQEKINMDMHSAKEKARKKMEGTCSITPMALRRGALYMQLL